MRVHVVCGGVEKPRGSMPGRYLRQAAGCQFPNNDTDCSHTVDSQPLEALLVFPFCFVPFVFRAEGHAPLRRSITTAQQSGAKENADSHE